MKIFKNYLFLGLLSVSLVSIMLSCKKDDTVDLIGNWVVRSDFEGDSRSDAVAFSIGNVGYVGTGLVDNEAVSDFWSYNADDDNWTEVASLPDTAARNGAVAFSAAGKGYVGTGYNGTKKLNDFWAFDPDANTWDTITRFKGSARYGAVAFSINDIGYMGTGYDGSNLKDFWAYDPATDDWSQKTSYQSKVRDAVGFVLNNKGYICTGFGNEYENNFYMFDAENNTWTVKRKIANVSDDSYDDDYTIVRQKAVAFLVGTKAYIATGDKSGIVNDVWEYDAVTDLWVARTNFEGSPRKDAVAFTTEDGRGFITTGLSSNTAYDDTWEFKPLEPYNNED
jgi:N-acetylneuraminic acid mutarotase